MRGGGETEALGGVDMREARDLAEMRCLDGGWSSERDDWHATITREGVRRRMRPLLGDVNALSQRSQQSSAPQAEAAIA